MPESIAEVLSELAKASPYALIFGLVIWVMHLTHIKQNETNEKLMNKSIEEIRKAYSDVSDKLPKLYERIMDRSDTKG